MNSFSQFVKSQKEKDTEYFFGKITKMSNKYFKFEHIIDEDNIIVTTKNVKILKDNYVLIIDNNKGVYLKDWQVREIHNYDLGFNGYAVKLNRNYFRPYTFNFNFDDLSFEKEDTFESLKETAKSQNDTTIAQGWMN